MTTWTNGEDLTKAEEKNLRGLIARNRDIYEHGAKALEFMEEKKVQQERQQAWVTRHGLSCFRCGATLTDWAKGGVNEWGKAWCICTRCVRRPK